MFLVEQVQREPIRVPLEGEIPDPKFAGMCVLGFRLCFRMNLNLLLFLFPGWWGKVRSWI
jgi:hypothetical protein